MDAKKFKSLGIDLEKAPGYVLIENVDKVLSYLSEQLKDAGVYILPLNEALKKFPWAKNYIWGILRKNKDEYTRRADVNLGYFIYAEPGAKSPIPAQACLYISRDRVLQPVHNVIIADEGAELDVVTGCTTSVNEAFHIGVSEFYVKKDAQIRFLMVHNWSKGTEARPRTGVFVEEGGKYISYYANFYAAKLVQAKPYIIVKEHGYANSTSVLYAPKETKFDIGGEIHLIGEGARGELISRSVLERGSYVRSPLEIHAETDGVSGHIECKALQLEESVVETVPLLVSKAKDVDLSHEAFVGRIERRKVEYLMSKGLDEEEAVRLILRGFLRVDIPFTTEEFRRQLDFVARLVAERATG